MVANLQLPRSSNSVKRLDCPPEMLSPGGLASCITKRTLVFFGVLEANGQEKAGQFLVKDPAHWPDDPVYKRMKQSASSMTVVNDSAERAIASMQQYNSTQTKNEEQKQLLLRLVAQHRKTFPTCSKATLTKNEHSD